MPIEFLTEEQKNQYGCFNGEPNDTQLVRYFHIDDTALTLINKRRGDYNRLGFALQLTTVRFLGTFLPDRTDVPINVLNFIAQQVDTGTDNLKQYMSRKVTRYSHSTEIQSFYGYHEFNNAYWGGRPSGFFTTQVNTNTCFAMALLCFNFHNNIEVPASP
ncbi:DUF4158 domain-containing protein [Psychromonas aquimarina]|uniref:DUF4158 domain-containing protein n=1 Tax=Psychromonas aquimarina TaxID=444919 RepID=UPI0009FCA34B|nr:DUF4158 domain-containing protein [Psychromonas aquimarina]